MKINRNKAAIIILCFFVLIFIVGLYYSSQQTNTVSNNQDSMSESELQNPNNPPVSDIKTSYDSPAIYESVTSVVTESSLTTGADIGNPNIPSSQSIQFAQTDKYVMQYSEFNDSILISILAAPFDTNRFEAENDLLEILELEPSDACKIKVAITTPRFANPDKAGNTYRLSFCR